MVGELNRSEVEDVLRAHVIGRLGCHAFGRTYVVPITYAYDGRYVYAHSDEGMKLHMMRENPHVCFEVDHMDDLANWRSVIAWGTFEEVRAPHERAEALDLLIDRIAPHLHDTPPGSSAHPHAGMKDAVLYRIALETKTGRFERRL
jgi:nitroimidazol reductase NimA-like FMN-containing flavoprotein (pyridoxamine 5'-phosphate oxidase superfamily)